MSDYEFRGVITPKDGSASPLGCLVLILGACIAAGALKCNGPSNHTFGTSGQRAPQPEHGAPAESQKQKDPTLGARVIDVPAKAEPIGAEIIEPNLIRNGDFAEHWSVGWQKTLRDRTVGHLTAEIVGAADSDDRMLHVKLLGPNAGWIEQVVEVDSESVNALHLSFECKMKTKSEGIFAGFEPIDAALIVQFGDSQGKTLGQIWYSNGKSPLFESTGLPGVPESIESNAKRYIVQIGEGYHRVNDNLCTRFLDGIAGGDVRNTRRVTIAAFLQAKRRNDEAEMWLDKVRLFYGEKPPFKRPQKATASANVVPAGNEMHNENRPDQAAVASPKREKELHDLPPQHGKDASIAPKVQPKPVPATRASDPSLDALIERREREEKDREEREQSREIMRKGPGRRGTQ
jgi:hypothetical protein